jgi:hypothetical protein
MPVKERRSILPSENPSVRATLIGIAILMASVVAAAAKDWQCGRDLVVIDVGEVSGIIYRNGDPKRAEDLIMGGIYNHPSREFRWKNGKLFKLGKPCREAE